MTSALSLSFLKIAGFSNLQNGFRFNFLSLVSDILDTLEEIATGIGGFISGIFTSVSGLFYTAAVAPETTGQLTLLGILALISVVFSLALWALRFVLRLFKLKG